MIISVIPVIVIFMILLGINARDMANRQYKKYRALSNNFIDTIRGVETLKFLGVSKNYLPIMEKKNREYRQSTMKTLSVAFLNSFALDFLTTIAIALLAVRLGILLLDGSTVLLPSLTVLLIAPEFFLPMKQAATDYHATLDGQMAYEDINRMIIDNEKNKSEKSSIESVDSIELKNIEKEVPLEVNTIGSLPSGYELVSATADVTKVTIRAEDANELAKINEMFVDVDLSDVKEETEERSNLKIYPKENVRIATDTPIVKVTIKIRKK